MVSRESGWDGKWVNWGESAWFVGVDGVDGMVSVYSMVGLVELLGTVLGAENVGVSPTQ